MNKGLLRLILVGIAGLVGAGMTAQYSNSVTERFVQDNNPNRGLVAVSLSLLGFVVAAGLATVLVWAWERISRSWLQARSGDKVTLVIGILMGMVVASPILLIFSSSGAFIAPTATIVTLISSSLIMFFALRSMRDALPWYREDRPARRSGIKILDTNTIIDGRIYDVLQSGFIEGQLYIPKFVLEEIQHIADSADPLRRQRGKRGLDVLKLIEDQFALEAGSKDHLLGGAREEVDSKLVRLAQLLGADLVTNDMNLNSVARLQKVRVLNINDLALAMKPNILPNEKLALTIVKEGSQANQGVGYLDDGTMVVVEGGRPHLNEILEVKVTQIIQTERGKMIFAEAPDFDANRNKRYGR
ncbi:MAG: hypothetical protein JNJ45_05335 [Chthonomonas sp.]|nr:hypothetical protein [Chthonomonas sp.]